MENVKIIRKLKIKDRRAEQKKLQNERNALRSYYDENLNEINFLTENLNSKENYFDKLSDELVLHIFKFIPRKILLTYGIVCKRWYKLILDESLWQSFDLSDKVVNGEILMKLLNRGVKIFGLAQTDIRRSTKKIITNNDSFLKSLPSQLDCYLLKNLKLEYLDLTNAIIDTSSVNILLKHCRNLKKISLESLEIDNQTFFYLSANKQLETLNLCQCKGIKIEGLVTILESLKILMCFNLAWTYLNRESVVIICKYLPKTMRSLNLAGCKTTLLDDDVFNLANTCPNLIELDLSDAQSLSRASVEKIAKSLPLLEHVSFSRCYSIIPQSYLILGKLKNLISLDLFNVLKDNSIEFLKNHIPSLKYFNRCLFSTIARPRTNEKPYMLWDYNKKSEL